MSFVVTVFGSARAEPGSPLYQEAMRLGELLGAAGFGVATGGYGGVMEAVLRGAALYAVRRIGVVTPELRQRQVNPYVAELLSVPTYLERLHRLLQLGDAYVLLPGGTGTLLELFAVLALRERSLLPSRPVFCLGHPWSEVFGRLVEVLPELAPARQLVSLCQTPDEVLDQLRYALLGGR
ncbi:Cytokinin riboside 5'-monophosphate phosphoribohydrolase [bacterium HR21]|nr:Cytokinin riboside 5'-monophosphate phosphoribohydrolase [bacterium HR21]